MPPPACSGDRSVCSAHPAMARVRALPPEQLVAELPDAEHGPAGQPQRPRGVQRAQQPDPRLDRRERPQDGVQQVGRDAVPVVVRLPPAVPVAGRELLHGGGGGVHVAVQAYGPAVREQMGQYSRGVPPRQAQVQPGQHRGGESQRVERAEQVAEVAGGGDVPGPHGATRLPGRLQDPDGPPGVGEQVGGHQAVVPGPDDDRIHGVHGRTVPRLRPFSRIGGGHMN